jgi:mobile intron protein
MRIISKFTEEEKQKIIDLYKTGKTPSQICKEVDSLKDRKPQTLYPILIKAGLYQKKDKNDLRRFKVNDHYFDVIDNEHKAYWLGLLLADGFLSNSGHATESFGISLSIKDKYILEEFVKDLESTYTVKEYIGKSKFENSCTDFAYAKLLIKSKQIFNKLIEYGFTTKKSYDGVVPEEYIPDNLKIHFIRGYFDGNGGLSIGSGSHLYTLDFTGTKEIITWILKYFDKENLKLQERHPDRDNNNVSIKISGDKQIYSIMNKIYKDATIYLTRKYDRYLKLQEKYNKN